MEGHRGAFTDFYGRRRRALRVALGRIGARPSKKPMRAYRSRRPTTRLVIVCHDFGCAQRTPVGLSAGDLATLELVARARPRFGGGGASGHRGGRSVVRPPRRSGGRRRHRIARANGLGDANKLGQMDCIDTSRNSTSLLLILEQLKLLHHHKVEAPEARGFLLDGRGPHATAVLTDIHTGKQWAVDSWTHKYGEKPDVIARRVEAAELSSVCSCGLPRFRKGGVLRPGRRGGVDQRPFPL